MFYQFLKDIYQANCVIERFWALPHVSSASSMAVDWLSDGTYYTVNAFVESTLGVSKNSTKIFTTTATKLLKRLTVTVTSLTNVTTNSANVQTIACQLADDLKVPTYFLLPAATTSVPDSTNALLFVNTYSYTVLYNRLTSRYDPATFVAGLDTSGTPA